ncbi:hypothetical protein KC19_1G165700 [Ceratodon purpureus]|uniref:VDE lipocalin domain-containing protein n=1 Tax=Ceratodon purpureus TaxID=3225 RepID=A0A8T0J983_CERPU|nr:hypothetical protein KC19_1G165700 [Ceratodon purpureus]
MAAVQALLSLPHLACGNPLQPSAQSVSAPAAQFRSLFSRPCLGVLLPRSGQSSWIASRGRCRARAQRECRNTEAASASSTEVRESTSLYQGFALQAAAAIAAGVLLWGGSNALAADPLKTCACLLKECRVELAKCIADPKCAANVACLQTCNGRPDETECQIGCGDLFENKVVDEFNDCAVTRKGCVPQKQDEGRFPVPAPEALVPEFDTTRFTGTWYITSGLNKTFDTFDCQKHEFTAEPQKLSGNLSWRIATPDGGFFTRGTVQNFVQDDKQPGILLNHGNEFLHYQDDWYIPASRIENKPDDYVFIYYRGKNDAWDGYGGAVVYTKSPKLPESIIPELQAAAKKVNLDFSKFTTTDNTCGPEPPLIARLEKTVERGEEFVEKEVEEGEKFVEKEVEEGESFLVAVTKKLGQAQQSLFGRLGKGAQQLQLDEERFLQELGVEEKQMLKDLEMDAADVGKLFGNAIPIRKLR